MAVEHSPSLKPYQARIVEEHDQLASKIAKLNAFIDSGQTPNGGEDEMELMIMQQNAMTAYQEVLVKRIALMPF